MKGRGGDAPVLLLYLLLKLLHLLLLPLLLCLPLLLLLPARRDCCDLLPLP